MEELGALALPVRPAAEHDNPGALGDVPLLDGADALDLPPGIPVAGGPFTSDLLGAGGLASSEDTTPAPSSGGGGRGGEAEAEEMARRKRRRAAWQAEQEAAKRWDLQRRLADISVDVEFLTREVARVRAEVQAPLPEGGLPECERAALEALRAKRLADLITNQCKKALQMITSHKWSWPFNHPVDTKVYKDYLQVVETPIDFTMITRRINSGYYKHPDAFLAEVRLVFTNARAYNKPGSDVFVMANTLQERFEEKFTTSVVPRLVEEAELARKEAEAARRRAVEAYVRPGGDAVDQHLALLVRHMDEVSMSMLDAKSSAAALCAPLPRGTRQALCHALGGLRQDHFELAMGLVLAHQPGLQPYEDIGFDIDSLDALTLRQLQSFVKACQEEEEAGGSASPALGGGRVPWPALPMGAGARSSRPKRQRQQAAAAAGQEAGGVAPSPALLPGVLAPMASSAVAPKPLGPAAAAPGGSGRRQPSGQPRSRPRLLSAPRGRKGSSGQPVPAAVQMLNHHKRQRAAAPAAAKPAAAAVAVSQQATAAAGGSFETKNRRRGRPAWMRSPDDTPLRDGNRDRLMGLLTERAVKTLAFYFMELNPTLNLWLNKFLEENPIPRDGNWDDIAKEFVQELKCVSEENRRSAGFDCDWIAVAQRTIGLLNSACGGSGSAMTERAWRQPSCACADGASGVGAPLVLYNSLVDRKVPFIPSAGADSKQITWYACGPTVYDVAHMGHARNYISFDIVRRILEDYFGYSILYVMNVTDVDDKIIVRARRNHLLASYAAAAADPAAVHADVAAALAEAAARQAAKVAAAEAALAAEAEAPPAPSPGGAASGDKAAERRREELGTNLAQERLLAAKAAAAAGALAAGGPGAGIPAMLEVGADALAEKLDRELGASVTDPAIFRAHAARYEAEFLDDMAALGVRLPSVLTRVSEYIPEIVEYVSTILANGLAYEAGGSVYFDTQAFRTKGHTYGKLNPWAVGAAALAGESPDGGDKRHPTDFALWKAQKPGEPAWDSPWGPGRPGWHIDAMASAIVGPVLDIHSGGEDLRFPHHDNELAQAEAYYHCQGCQQWVNYFLHSGHLGIEGLKMSKSLKNFVTIKEALKSFTARQLRLMFVLQPWDKKMSYGESAKEEMRAKESLLRNFFANVDVVLRKQKVATSANRWEEDDRQLQAELDAAQRRVHASLCDNLNTAAAMAAICDLIKAVNVHLARQASAPKALLLRAAAAYVTRVLSVFGLAPAPGDSLGFATDAPGGVAGGAGAGADVVHDLLDAFCECRDRVRALARAKAPAAELAAAAGAADAAADAAAAGGAAGCGQPAAVLAALRVFRTEVAALADGGAAPAAILAACDRVRDETMVDLGVRLEDQADGSSVWKADDPAVLRAEAAERAAAAAEARAKKARAQLEGKRKDLDKLQKLAALPTPQEALRDKYSAFDPTTGDPTRDKDGAALEGKAADKAKKEMEKQRKASGAEGRGAGGGGAGGRGSGGAGERRRRPRRLPRGARCRPGALSPRPLARPARPLRPPPPTPPPPPALPQMRAPLEKKLSEDPRLFESLAEEIARLEGELAALAGPAAAAANGAT
eukprot:scaffold12.g8002.t1